MMPPNQQQNQVTSVLLCGPWPVRPRWATSGWKAVMLARSEVPESSFPPCFWMLLPLVRLMVATATSWWSDLRHHPQGILRFWSCVVTVILSHWAFSSFLDEDALRQGFRRLIFPGTSMFELKKKSSTSLTGFLRIALFCLSSSK